MKSHRIPATPSDVPGGSLLGESTDFQLVDAKHGQFITFRADPYIGRSLKYYGEWCESEIELLAPYIKEGAVVLDIGANIGTHTVAFARLVGSGGTVIAAEPQPLVHQVLTTNVILNGHCHVRTLNAAVGADPGELHVTRVPPGAAVNHGAFSIDHDVFRTGSEAVPIVTIDGLRLSQCDLIKIDVEGHELGVLNGAVETLERCRPVLYLENNRTDERASQLTAWLYDHGYVPYWHVANYFRKSNFNSKPLNIFSGTPPESNQLALPTDTSPPPALPVARVGETWKDHFRTL